MPEPQHSTSPKIPDIAAVNRELADKIEQENLMPPEELASMLDICNASKSHLGQVLVKDSRLKMSDLVRLMRGANDKTRIREGVNAAVPQPTDSVALGGSKFGAYEILGEIARGGMGIVYRARKTGESTVVALKVLLTGAMSDQTQVRRFLREAQATAQLKHPHIVPIYDMGEERGYHYFTMKYIDGGTYEKYIQRTDVTLHDKIHIFIQVCQALAYAHDNKILHRDIKPSNILLDREQQPYLSDFGLAKFVDSVSHFTQTGSAIGTPFYMPPEQVKGERNKVTHRSDIYSLGVMLYQMLTDRLPFTGDTLTELYRKICEEEPQPPHTIKADVPPALAAICLKAMEKSPDMRYASAADMAADLISFCEGHKAKAQQLSMRRLLAHARRRYRRQVTIVFLALVALLVAASVGYGGYSLYKREQARQQQFASEVKGKCQQAERMLADGQPLAAIELLQNLEKASEWFRLHLVLARCYHRLGDTSKARLAFARAYAAAPDEPDVFYHKGLFHHAGGEQQEALALLDRYCRALPSAAGGYLARAGVRESLGEKDKAAADRERADTLLRGELDSIVAEFADSPAESGWDKLAAFLRQYPGYARGYWQRAQLHRRRGQLHQALNDISQAAEIAPTSEYLWCKANWLYDAGYIKEAARDFNLALQKSSNGIERMQLSYLLAGCELRLQQYRQSYQHYLEVSAYRPVSGGDKVPTDITLKLGQAAFYCDEQKQAFASLRQAASELSGQERGEALYYLGMLQQKCGDSESAIASFTQALALEPPQTAEICLALGEHHLAQRRFTQALPYLEKAAASFPFRPQIFAGVGACQLEIGKPEAAVVSFTRAIELEPWQASYYAGRTRAYSRLRQYGKAELDIVTWQKLTTDSLEPVIQIFENAFEEGFIYNFGRLSLMLRNFNYFTFVCANPDLYEARINALNASYVQAAMQAAQNKQNQRVWDEKQTRILLQGMMESESPAIHDMTYTALLPMYQEKRLYALLEELQRQERRQAVRERLRKLHEDIYARYLEDEKVVVRLALVRFYSVHDKEALKPIYRSGDTGVHCLRAILTDDKEDVIVRHQAAQALRDLYTVPAARTLQELVRSPDPLVRMFCLHVSHDAPFDSSLVERMPQFADAYARSVAAQLVPLQFASAVDRLLRDGDARVQLSMAQRLRKAGDANAEPCLRRHFTHADPLLRAYAIGVYWDLESLKKALPAAAYNALEKRALENLSELVAATDDGDVRVRRLALARLDALNNELHSPVLARHLQDSDDFTRYMCITNLAKRGEKKYIVPILTDTKEKLLFRVAVLMGAGPVRTTLYGETVIVMYQKLMKDPDPRIRILMFSVLGMLDTKATRSMGPKLIGQYVNSDDYATRMGCVAGIIRNKTSANWPHITKLMEDKNEQVRMFSFAAATYIGIRTQRPELDAVHNRLLKSPREWRVAGAIGYNLLMQTRMSQKKEEVSEVNWAWSDLYPDFINIAARKLTAMVNAPAARNNDEELEYPYTVDEYLLCATRALELDDSVAKYWFERGIIYYAKRMYRASIADMEKAVSIDPDSPLFKMWLARLYNYDKQHGKALRLLEEIAMAYAWDRDFCLLHSQVLEALGRQTEAAALRERLALLEKK